MINVLIFSKNRAMQLDLLLRSIDQYFFIVPRDVHVLVKATTEDYDEGYGILRKRYRDVVIHRQWPDTPFKDQVMDIVDSFNYDYTVCFLDDDVVINRVDVLPTLAFMDLDVNALSLRMSPEMDYCYPKDQFMKVPKFESVYTNLYKD